MLGISRRAQEVGEIADKPMEIGSGYLARLVKRAKELAYGQTTVAELSGCIRTVVGAAIKGYLLLALLTTEFSASWSEGGPRKARSGDSSTDFY